MAFVAERFLRVMIAVDREGVVMDVKSLLPPSLSSRAGVGVKAYRYVGTVVSVRA